MYVADGLMQLCGDALQLVVVQSPGAQQTVATDHLLPQQSKGVPAFYFALYSVLGATWEAVGMDLGRTVQPVFKLF